MTKLIDDVTRIHKRYSLTLINPPSFYHSLIISIVVTSLLVIITDRYYFHSDYDFTFRILCTIIILLITQYVDSRVIKNKEYSKAIHMSLFGNTIWLLTAAVGILSTYILAKSEISISYIIEGMFLFASFRIGILTTTLGVKIIKSWMICFIQPISMILILLPLDVLMDIQSHILTICNGVIFLIIATVWSILTDKAGKPNIKSTHRLIQAYLSSITNNDPKEVESIIEENSIESEICTLQIKLFQENSNDSDFRLVLPEIHPGPFHPIGGSNMPYLIYKKMKSSAMVMHSISDHSLNLPTQLEVKKYIESLEKENILQNGSMCTEPIITNVNKARVTGFILEKTVVLFLSLSPYGSEDLPISIQNELEQFSKRYKLKHSLIIDCHNSMGKVILETDKLDLIEAAKINIKTAINKIQYEFKFGYANSIDLNLQAKDLGCSGISVLCLYINNKKYFFGWADSNNMENGIREKIISEFQKNNCNLLEIATSDTHYTTKNVRNRNGYYQFGIITDYDKITKWYLSVAKKAEIKIKSANFEIIENKTSVKVMGSKIYSEYSNAVDNSIRITKLFLIGSLVFLFLTMM